MATIAKIEIFGIETHPYVKVIVIEGNIDESNLHTVKTKMDAVINDDEVKAIILDFKSLMYINSKVVGYLANTYSLMTEKGGKIIIAGASESMKDIISMVGLNLIIDCVDTIEDAVGVIDGSPDLLKKHEKVKSSESKTEKVHITNIEVPKTERQEAEKHSFSQPQEEEKKKESQEAIKTTVMPPIQVPKQKEEEQQAPQKPVAHPVVPTPTQPQERNEVKGSASVKAENPDKVVLILELAPDAHADNAYIYQTPDGNIVARILDEKEKGKKLEVSIAVGKYFFKNHSAEDHTDKDKGKNHIFSFLRKK
jgi:anti-anti-sigma factor